MKPVGSLRNGGGATTPKFSVQFDDGITILLKTKGGELVYDSMISVGLDSYYLKHMKWPSGKQLEKRADLAIKYVNNNLKKNRYRKQKVEEDEN